MNKSILYPAPGGRIAVIFPVSSELTIEEIAKKDVPAGVPYFIVEASALPALDKQEAWECDFTAQQCVITINPAKIKAIPNRVSYAQWLSLFTETERAWGFSSNNPTVREMITRATAENSVDLNSSTVAGFLDLCISLGSPLTAARKTRILAGQPPA